MKLPTLRASRRIVRGADSGSPLWDSYKPPSTLTGTLHSLIIDVGGDLIVDPEAALRQAMARQWARAKRR